MAFCPSGEMSYSMKAFLHMRMPFGIYRYHAILIEKPLVALDRDLEVAAVLERQPGATIRQHVGVRCRRSAEGRAHPLAIDLYQGCLSTSTSMPGACQRLSSAMCVPERSPREMNGAPLSLMALNEIGRAHV